MRRRLARIVPLYVVTVRRVPRRWSGRRCCRCRGRRLAAADRQSPPVPAQPAPVAAWRDQRPELERGRGDAVLRARDRGGAAPVADRRALAHRRRRARRVGVAGARVLGHARPRQPESSRSSMRRRFRPCSMRSRSASAIARLHVDGTMARWTARSARPSAAGRRRAPSPSRSISSGTAIGRTPITGTNGAMVVFWRTGLALTFGALVLLAAQLPDITRVSSLRPLDYLGEISYGIYLWHLPVILALKEPFAGGLAGGAARDDARRRDRAFGADVAFPRAADHPALSLSASLPRRKTRSRTPWPSFMPRVSNLVSGRCSGRGAKPSRGVLEQRLGGERGQHLLRVLLPVGGDVQVARRCEAQRELVHERAASGAAACDGASWATGRGRRRARRRAMPAESSRPRPRRHRAASRARWRGRLRRSA